MKVVLQSIEGDIPLYFLLPAVASKNFIVDKDIGKVKTLWEGKKTFHFVLRYTQQPQNKWEVTQICVVFWENLNFNRKESFSST